MSNNNIEIIFFDINDLVEEENDNNEQKEKEEEIKAEKEEEKIEKDEEKEEKNKEKEISFPLKVIGYFLENQILIDMEAEEYEDYYQYSFIYQIQKDVAKHCNFYVFSKITQESFSIDSNALFIFCDLENEKNKGALEKVIENIKRICQQDIKIYILGIIKSNNKCVLNKENISKLFEEEEIHMKYKEININTKKNINKNEDNNEDNNENNENNNNIIIENNENNNNENNNNNEDDKKENVDKKNEENLKKDIFEEIDKFIEESMIDIYEYENSKKPRFSKRGRERELNNYSSCIVY